jgi:hypothetical protein
MPILNMGMGSGIALRNEKGARLRYILETITALLRATYVDPHIFNMRYTEFRGDDIV